MNRPLIAAVAASLLFSLPAVAGTNEYTALMKARKYTEAERAAAARLLKEPDNAEALAARTEAIAAIGNQARIGEAIKAAEECVRLHPANATCHLVLGKALGWKAMAGGILSAMSYAGDIRNAFKKAVELDPRNLDARFSLLQYYMMAPSIAGGGSGKASDLAAQTGSVSPEAAKIMLAMMEMREGNVGQAESIAGTVRAGADDELRDRHEDLLVSIAGKYLSEKKLTEAERAVQAAVRHYPDSDTAAFMGGRLRQEQGRHRDALTAFEALLAKNSRSYVFYRMGQSYQALGDKAKATAAFQKALAGTPTLNDKQKSDAQSQLATLKG